MLKKAGEATTRKALTHAAPVGEKQSYVERLLGVVRQGMVG